MSDGIIYNISDNNFEQCLKCSICTVYCPVSNVEPLYPGPKQSGPDGERYRLKNPRFYDDSLRLCLNCKRCEVACPHDVRIGDIIASARLKYSKRKPGIRAQLLARTDTVGRIATALNPATNALLKLKSTKLMMHSMLGIDKHYTFPTYAQSTFRKIFKNTLLKSQAEYSQQVALFHGCHVNYNNPSLGINLVKVLNAMGVGVSLLRNEKCCGNPFIANGMPLKAQKLAKQNLNTLSEAVANTHDIITLSPTCTFTMRDEYKFVLGLDNSDVRDHITLATRFIYKKIEDGTLSLPNVDPNFRMRVAYHASCHMEKLGWALYSVALLRMIPGVEVVMLDSLCCGMAGTYGFKTENYERSRRIGEPLFNAINEANVDAVVTDCEMCRWQIEMATGKSVLHPIDLLTMALQA